LPVVQNSSSVFGIYPVGTGAGTATVGVGLDVSPSNVAVASFSPQPGLGSIIQTLSQCFERYRMLRLKYSYIPGVGTNWQGGIQLGYSPDPYATGGVTPVLVTSLRDNFDCAVWQEACLECTTLDKGWKYVYVANANEEAQRLGYAGTLVFSTQPQISAPSGSTSDNNIGSLYVEGEIEFMGLGSSSLLMSNLIPALSKTLRENPPRSLDDLEKVSSLVREWSERMVDPHNGAYLKSIPEEGPAHRPTLSVDTFTPPLSAASSSSSNLPPTSSGLSLFRRA